MCPSTGISYPKPEPNTFSFNSPKGACPECNGLGTLLTADPPEQTRYRLLVSKAFTPAAIAALRPVIEDLVDAALDEMEERGTTEIVHDLAFPLPFDVISEMLGMPEADKDLIAGWSGAIVKTLDDMPYRTVVTP